MMAYRLKVTFVTNGKEYQPGDILPADISESDLDFLKTKKFVEVVDASAEDLEEDEDCFEGFQWSNVGNFNTKSVEEIKRIRTKKELAAYAALIGLNVGDYKEKSLKELQEEIINYQEERLNMNDEDDEKSEDGKDGRDHAKNEGDGDR